MWEGHHGKRVWGTSSDPAGNPEYAKLFQEAAGAKSGARAIETEALLNRRPERLKRFEGAAGHFSLPRGPEALDTTMVGGIMQGTDIGPGFPRRASRPKLEGAAGGISRPVIWRYHESTKEVAPQVYEPPPKLGYLELIHKHEQFKQEEQRSWEQRRAQAEQRQRRAFDGAFGIASDRGEHREGGGRRRIAVGGPEHLNAPEGHPLADPTQEALGEQLYDGAAGCKSAWRSPRQEGIRPAPVANFSQLEEHSTENREQRLRDFEGAAGRRSGLLLGRQRELLPQSAAERAGWGRQEMGSYLARSPRDREIIDKMIAGVELTIG